MARVLTPLLALALLFAPSVSHAQTKGAAPAAAPAPCDPARALSLVEQQAAEAQMIADVPRRVAVAARAADLLWPQRRRAARELFEQSYDLATAYARERPGAHQTIKGRADSKLTALSVETPDLRFVVLRAVARRDPAWAKELARRAVRDDRDAAAEKPNASEWERQKAAADLLTLAEELWKVDRGAAGEAFRMSFAHPASYYLPRLLYKVAETDYAQADALFREALAAYAASVEDLIYLSPFPFGYFRPVAETLARHHAAAPRGFTPSPATQRLYVEALLSAAQRRLDAGVAPDRNRMSPRHTAHGQIYTALTALEPLIARSLPHLVGRAAQLRARAAAELNRHELSLMTRYAREPFVSGTTPHAAEGGEITGPDIDTVLRDAARETNPDRRDRVLVQGLMSRVSPEGLERVAEAAQHIGDELTRRQFLDYIFFQSAERALKAGALDDATRLAERVAAVDQRALLLLLIAEEHLKRPDEADRVARLLAAVAAAAEKSPETEAKARALLGLTHLAAGHDQLLAQRALSDAVKVINQLEAPELMRAFLVRRIEGREFNFNTSTVVPAYNLENVFREFGRRDFEAAVAIAYGLDDRHLRAVAVLAFSAPCLEEAERKKPTKKSAAKQAPR